MKTTWIPEYGGSQVPILRTLGTISVESWHRDLSALTPNYLGTSANSWILTTNCYEKGPNSYDIQSQLPKLTVGS